MNRYKVYGLHIMSEIELPELMESYESRCDVNIILGQLPDEVEQARLRNGIRCYLEEMAWFHVPGIATYCMIGGNEIRVKVENSANPMRVRAFLLGRALGMLMFQREMVVMHGGVVDFHGKGILLTGESGAGKSSLLSGFIENGYKFLTDDVAAIVPNEEYGFVVEPAFALRKICYDTMSKVGYSQEDTRVVNHTRGKCAWWEKDLFSTSQVQLHSIIEIEEGEVEEVKLIPLSGMKKMDAMMRNDYWMRSLARNIGMPRKSMKQIIDIVKTIQIYRLIRPVGVFSIDEQMKLIKETMNDECNSLHKRLLT